MTKKSAGRYPMGGQHTLILMSLFQNTSSCSHCTLLTSTPQRQNLSQKAPGFPRTLVRQSSTSPDDLGSCQSVGPQHRFSTDILLVYARLLRKALLTTMVISKQTAATKVAGPVPQTEGIQWCPEPRQPSAPALPRFL